MHKKNHKSIVNKVFSHFDLDKKIISKEFYNIAIKTKIPLPLLRSEIEFRVNNYLQKVCKNYKYIKVPNIVFYDKVNHIITYDYIDSPNVFSLNLLEYPKKEVWVELFEFLREIEKTEIFLQEKLFSKLEKISEECRTIIYKYKLNKNIKERQEKDVLCLGDVNLKNMIWHNNTLYLYDFEFSHIGSRGYDLGQITAQLLLNYNSNFIKNTAFDKNTIKWQKKFINYYKRK